jgi:hypothetical protein
MPAVSTAQQALMGQAYGIKTGEIKPADLNPKYRDQILALASSMTKKELEKFAKTKHKNLPYHVKESDETNNEMEVSVEAVQSAEIPTFVPKGPGKIVPFLDPDSKQKVKGKKNLQNLKDYRDWIGSK